ncbi:hypothetical protein [Undibacterium sp. Xuan67W]|uniref:hypothetical protein n=1 Tax=Undibacterium sp. Xuan67W TaxID=3413057 RepID=UPI003BF2E1FC
MLTIHQIRKNSHAVQLLGEYFDFEVWSESEIDLPDWLNLSTKEKFIPFASEGAGGVFLVGNSTQRVMYVTSEGSAGWTAEYVVRVRLV